MNLFTAILLSSLAITNTCASSFDNDTFELDFELLKSGNELDDKVPLIDHEEHLRYAKYWNNYLPSDFKNRVMSWIYFGDLNLLDKNNEKSNLPVLVDVINSKTVLIAGEYVPIEKKNALVERSDELSTTVLSKYGGKSVFIKFDKYSEVRSSFIAKEKISWPTNELECLDRLGYLLAYTYLNHKKVIMLRWLEGSGSSSYSLLDLMASSTKRITNPHRLIDIKNAVFSELSRIHSLDISHGNLNPKNIRMTLYESNGKKFFNATFINFSFGAGEGSSRRFIKDWNDYTALSKTLDEYGQKLKPPKSNRPQSNERFNWNQWLETFGL